MNHRCIGYLRVAYPITLHKSAKEWLVKHKNKWSTGLQIPQMSIRLSIYSFCWSNKSTPELRSAAAVLVAQHRRLGGSQKARAFWLGQLDPGGYTIKIWFIIRTRHQCNRAVIRPFSQFRTLHTQQCCQGLITILPTCLHMQTKNVCPQGKRFMITSCNTSNSVSLQVFTWYPLVHSWQ